MNPLQSELQKNNLIPNPIHEAISQVLNNPSRMHYIHCTNSQKAQTAVNILNGLGLTAYVPFASSNVALVHYKAQETLKSTP